MSSDLFKYLTIKDPRVNNITADDTDFLTGVPVVAELGGIKRVFVLRPGADLGSQFNKSMEALKSAIDGEAGFLPLDVRLKFERVCAQASSRTGANCYPGGWTKELALQLLGHALGDRFLAKSPYEGFAISEACHYVLAYFNDPKLGSQRRFRFSPLADSLPLIEKAAAMARDSKALQTDTVEQGLLRCKKLAKDFNAVVVALKPGEKALLPGGWASKSGGHAMYYLIERKVDGTFTFKAYNTGAGSEYHSPKKGDQIPPCFCIERILPDAFAREGEAIFRQLLDQRMPIRHNGEDPKHSGKKLYENILAKMTLPAWGGCVAEVPSAYFITPQRSGTCVWQGLMALLLDLGGSQKLYKAFVLDIKIEILNFALAVAKKSSLEPSDERLMLRCARQLSGSVSNRHSQNQTDPASRKKALAVVESIFSYLEETRTNRPPLGARVFYSEKANVWEAETHKELASFSSPLQCQNRPEFRLPTLTVQSLASVLTQMLAELKQSGVSSLEALARLETTILALNRFVFDASQISAEQAEALLNGIAKLSEVYYERASLFGQSYHKACFDLSLAVDGRRYAFLTILLTLTDKCMRLVPQGLSLIDGLSLPLLPPYYQAHIGAAVADTELLVELDRAWLYLRELGQTCKDVVYVDEFEFHESGRLHSRRGHSSTTYLQRLLNQTSLFREQTDVERTLLVLGDLVGKYTHTCHGQLVISLARLECKTLYSRDSEEHTTNTGGLPRVVRVQAGVVMMTYPDVSSLSLKKNRHRATVPGSWLNFTAIETAEKCNLSEYEAGFSYVVHRVSQETSTQTRELSPVDRYRFVLLNQEGRVADSIEFFRARIDLFFDATLPWRIDFVRTLFLPGILASSMRGNPTMVAKLGEFCRFGYERASAVENQEAAAFFCLLDHLFADIARLLGMDTAAFAAPKIAMPEGVSQKGAAVLASFCILCEPDAPIERFAEWNCLFKTLPAGKMPPLVGVFFPAILRVVQKRADELEQLQADVRSGEKIWKKLAERLGHMEPYEPALGDAIDLPGGVLYIRGQVATQLPIDGKQAAVLSAAVGTRTIAWRAIALEQNGSGSSIYESVSDSVCYRVRIEAYLSKISIWRKRSQDSQWQNYITEVEGVPKILTRLTTMWSAEESLLIEDADGKPLARVSRDEIVNICPDSPVYGYTLLKDDDHPVSGALIRFEDSGGILHWHAPNGKGEVWSLPRYGMQFVLTNKGARWEQDPRYRLVQMPAAIATAPEFTQFLQLEDDREIRCLLPRATLEIKSTHALNLSPLDTHNLEQVRCFNLKLDEAGSLVAHTREEGLYLALVHAGQRQYQAALTYLNPLKVQRLGGFTSQEAEIVYWMLDFLEFSGDESLEAKALYIHFAYLVMKTGLAGLSREELSQVVLTRQNPVQKEKRQDAVKLAEALGKGTFLKLGHPLFIRPSVTRTLDLLFGIRRGQSQSATLPTSTKTEVSVAANDIRYYSSYKAHGFELCNKGHDVPKYFLLSDVDALKEAPYAWLQGLLSDDADLQKELIFRIHIMIENTTCSGTKKILQGLLHLPTLSLADKAIFKSVDKNSLEKRLVEIADLATSDEEVGCIPPLPELVALDAPERQFPTRAQVPLVPGAMYSVKFESVAAKTPSTIPLPEDLAEAFGIEGLKLTRTQRREFERLSEDTRVYLSQQAEPALQLDPSRRGEVRAKKEALAPKVLEKAAQLEALANKPTENEEDLVLHKHDLFSGRRKRITLDDCIISFLQNDASRLLEHNPNLAGQEQKLANLIEDYLLKATALHRLENTLKKLDDYESEKDAHSLEQAHSLYYGRRAYNSNTNRAAFVFEYYNCISLRPEQVALLDRMQKGAKTNKSEVHQLLMGSGKSKVLLPVLAYILSTGNRVPCVLVDEALFASNANDLRALSSGALQQSIETISIPDKTAFGLADAKFIRDSLERAKAEKGFILATWRSVHLFRMHWLGLVVEMTSSPARQRPELDAIYKETVAIRNLLKNSGLSLPDEADRCNDLLKAYNLALGDTIQIDIHERNLVLDLVGNILDDKNRAAALGLSQTLEGLFDSKAYEKRIARPLATQTLLCIEEEFSVTCPPESVEEVLAYLASAETLNTRPAWLERQEPAIRNVAASAKFMLKEVLPLVATRNPNRHYGLSHVQDTLYAIPYAEKGVPAEGSQFANPFETMLYTMLYYIKCGLHSGVVSYIVGKLKAEALEEFNKGGVRMEDTAGCRRFAAMRPTGFTKNLFQIGSVDHEGLAANWSCDQHFVAQVVHDFVLETIPIVAEYVTSTPFTLFDLFLCEQGFTGTVGNRGSWHRSLQADVTPGTDGKTVALLWKMKQDALIVAAAKEGCDPLFELCKGYNVLIDLASWLRDSSNTEVAQQLARSLITGGTIKGIVYYNDQDSPKGTKGLAVVIKSADSAPILLAECGLKPEELFTYYNFTVGADIKQALDAKALLTVDNNTTFEAFAQAFWRMRGVDGKQTVRIACRPQLVESLKSASCASMLRHFVANQGALQEKQNLKKLSQEADSLLKRHIEDALALLPVEEVRKKAVALKSLIVENGNISAYDAVGNVSTHIQISGYWAEIVWNVTNKYALASEILAMPSLTQFSNKLKTIFDPEILPERVWVPLGGATDSTLEIAQQQEQEKEKEQQIERSKIAVICADGKPWPVDGTIYSLEYLTEVQVLQPLDPDLPESLKGQFSPHLHATPAFISCTKVPESTLFTASAKPVQDILVIEEKNTGAIHLTLLIPDEAAFMRKRLLSDRSEGPYRLALMTPFMGINTQGPEPIDEAKLRALPLFKTLLEQVLRIDKRLITP